MQKKDVKPWYKKSWVAITTLVIVPPVGIGFVWCTDWPRKRKLVVTGAGLFWWLIVAVSDTSNPAEESVAEVAEATQPTADTASTEETPSEPEAVADSSTVNDVYTVTRIYDGDTMDAFQNGETIKVRLACIDAPEAAQSPHGQLSTDRLSSLVPGQVILNIVDKDRYERSVAEVYTPNGDFVNLQMLETGDAVVYTEYLDSCGETAEQLLAAEEGARSLGQGVWSEPDFIMPWDYRDGVRPAIAEPEPEPTVNLPACVNSDCNCSDFSSWSQAQAVLNGFPGDPHGLDRDNDGEACESLR